MNIMRWEYNGYSALEDMDMGRDCRKGLALGNDTIGMEAMYDINETDRVDGKKPCIEPLA
jgi:hypothetical protein